MKRLSARGAALIHEFEGLRLSAYQDEAGVWTIGYGHTGPVARAGNTITQDQADAFFDKDNDAAEAVVNRIDKRRVLPMTQEQFDALVSFEFNTGALSNPKNRVTQCAAECKDDLVDDEMLRWVHITDPKTRQKRVSNGLKRRRLAEAALWSKGSAPLAAQLKPEATPTPEAPATPAQQATTSPAVQGSAIAAASSVLSAATEGLEPLAPYSNALTVIFVAVALAGVALAVWGATRPRTAA